MSRRSVILSALMFALATNIKVLPLLFVPLFVYRREFRWLVCYAALAAAIAALPTLAGGLEYYRAFVDNLWNWHPAAFNSASFYSFFKRTGMLFEAGLPYNVLFNVIRVAVVLWVYAVSYFAVRRRVFCTNPDQRFAALVNGLVPMMFLLPAVAPTVWPFHLVLLIVPAVLTLTHMRGPRRVGLWSVGYFLTFVLPIFDFYPWSYLRLLGWLALLAALTDVVLSPPGRPWLGRLDEALCEAVDRVVGAYAGAPRAN
jgi:hypothetical protein